MRRQHRSRIIGLLGLLALLLGTASLVHAQGDFGSPEPGRHVYDRAGLLTPDEIALLEQEAASVGAAGAPVVVYLRLDDADYDDTVDDGRALMDAWDVQSRAAARNGIVLFFNLEPDDPRHGQFALIAGAAHFEDGNLPRRELDRITGTMQPLLRDERTAEAIATGLRMLEDDLLHGPSPAPEPSGTRQLADDLTRGPVSIVNAVALVVVSVVAILARRRWPGRRLQPVASDMATTVDRDLPPALAGALVRGRVEDTQLVGTILDLARRGAIVIEPEQPRPGKKQKDKVQIRLLDERHVRPGFEQQVWAAFVHEAGGAELLDSKRVQGVHKHWGRARDTLRAELRERSWFDPRIGQARRSLTIAGGALVLLGVVVACLALYAQQGRAFAGAALLLIAGVVLLVATASLAERTPAGDIAAGPWLWLQGHLKAASRNRTIVLDLDRVMPYAVALGSAGHLDKRLKQAGKEGYSPAWFGVTSDSRAWGDRFYPYWIAFNGSFSPSTSGAGFSGGGASAGSGASGGSF